MKLIVGDVVIGAVCEWDHHDLRRSSKAASYDLSVGLHEVFVREERSVQHVLVLERYHL